MEFRKPKPQAAGGSDGFDVEPEIDREMATYRFYYADVGGGQEELMI